MPILDTRWHFVSQRGVVLENGMLRVAVLPELGGRVWSLVYKPLDRELLWHNPEIPPGSIACHLLATSPLYGQQANSL